MDTRTEVERAFWRGPERAWRWTKLRVTAAVVAVTLLAGIASAAVIAHDSTSAPAAAATTCPSTSASYYEANDLAMCGYLVAPQWAAAAYVCAISIERGALTYGTLVPLVNYWDDDIRETCMEQVLASKTNIDNTSRLWYAIELYKKFVAYREAAPYINVLVPLYEFLAKQVGTGARYVTSGYTYVVCDGAVDVALWYFGAGSLTITERFIARLVGDQACHTAIRKLLGG